MRRRRSSNMDEAEVDLTPMLDVVFIMLIFFIVTASFVKEVGLDLNRPPPGSSQAQLKNENENILVQITNEGLIFIDRRSVDIRAVRANIERLHAERPNGQVIVAPGGASANGLLVEVMDQARLAGVTDIALAAELN